MTKAFRCSNCDTNIEKVIVTLDERGTVIYECDYCGHEEIDLDEFLFEICKCCGQKIR
ncbi:MAG: hypothetical protein WC185_04525 [Acholeplasmataceae bacterium]